MIAELTDLLPLRLLAKHEAWHLLPDWGSERQGLGSGAFVSLQRQRAAFARDEVAQAERSQHVRAYLKRLGDWSPPQRATLVEAARQKLASRHGEVSSRAEQTLQRLGRADPTLTDALSSTIKRRMTRGLERLERDTDWAIAQLTNGLLAQFHGEFNTAFNVAAKRDARKALADGDATKPFSLADLKHQNDHLAKLLRTKQRGLYEALVTTHPQGDVAIAAEAVASASAWLLRPHATLLAQGDLAARSLLHVGQGKSAQALGLELLRGNELARECIASFAASHAVACALGYGHANRAVAAAALAAGTPFDAEVPPKRNLVALGELPHTPDGAAVSIEGFVSAIQVIRAKDGKLLSRVELLDPVSGARGYAAAIYTHLFHIGVTKGSFCRATGVYRVQSKLFADKPLVEIERRALAEERTTSWRLGFLVDAQRWFRLYPNGEHLSWACGPQRRPRAPGDLTFEGAGELIYPPFVRKP